MSFLDSWVAFKEGQQDSLSQNSQYTQNTATGGQQEVFGDIGNIGRRESIQPAETSQSDFGNIGDFGNRYSPETRAGDCRQQLHDPGQAGAADWETLDAWKAEYPHLTPCPKAKDWFGGVKWVYRSKCQGCAWAVADEPKTLQ